MATLSRNSPNASAVLTRTPRKRWERSFGKSRKGSFLKKNTFSSDTDTWPKASAGPNSSRAGLPYRTPSPGMTHSKKCSKYLESGSTTTLPISTAKKQNITSMPAKRGSCSSALTNSSKTNVKSTYCQKMQGSSLEKKAKKSTASLRG